MRERLLQIVMVLDGVFFLAALYPIATNLWNKGTAGETMMLSIYFAIGVFLLLAVRTPSEHRSLIAFAGCANVAHGLVMSLMAMGLTADRRELLLASALCLVVGVPLIVLLPRRVSGAARLIESQASRHAHAG
ncbi:MAG TPA: DUF6632 domain-containing protein [Acidobacteriaceae bacterium]|nr:DUF6632 domain-containing protein [Acidobacteriaceae bacterium]